MMGDDRDNDDDDDDDVCLKWEQLSIGACALALPCLAWLMNDQSRMKTRMKICIFIKESTWLGKH